MAKVWKSKTHKQADAARFVLGLEVGDKVISTQTSTEDPNFLWCYPLGEFGPDTSRTGWVWVHDLEFQRELDGPWCRVNKGTCLQETLTCAFKKYRGRPCFGSRERLPTGGLGQYQWLAYEQVEKWVTDFACGLRSLTEPRSFICIASSNRMQWAVADLACAFQAMVSVPIHHKADRATVEFILLQTEASTVVCSRALVPVFAQVAPQCTKLKHIILMESDTTALPPLPSSITVHTMTDVTAHGAAHPRAPLTNPADELCTIMYTSGSTGTPKGAMMSERKWHNHLSHPYTLPDNLVTFSYGPFAHIQERQNIGITVITGGKISFYDGEMTQLFENVQLCSPTWISAVPRIWNELYLRYKDDLEKYIASELKSEPAKTSESFFKRRCELKVQKDYFPLLGGRIEYIVIGGALSSVELRDWLKTTFKCPIYDGYGTTEAGSIATDNIIGPGVSVRLVDVPELGYTSADKPNPRGEILVKSSQIIQGYYKDPKTTSEMFTEDGYFRTGDIGEKFPDGKLKIIDRRKNIFKLENGEFVAPEQLEQLYVQSEFVAQVFITGDSTRSFLATVVVPAFSVLQQWAEKNHSSLPASREEVCADPRVNKIVLASITAIATKSRLAAYEIPRALILHPDPLTEENGLITPSNKLKRPACSKFFAAKVNHFYEEMSWSYQKFMAMLEQMRNGKGSVDAKRTLVQLGTDSLAAMRLKEQIRTTFHKDIATEVLLTATLQELADMLLSNREADDVEAILSRAIDADLKLVVPTVQAMRSTASALTPAPLPFATILVTGATGFLALHVVLSLLRLAPAAQILCLVRGSSNEDARSRLLTIAAKHDVKWLDGWLARLEVICGDIGRDGLGLDAALYAQLAHRIDAVIHAAALVNWVLPYSQMREPNVLGTLYLLRFATTAKLKHFFHISTISTCSGTEEKMWPQPARLGAYAASKWVSESYVQQCLQAGLPGAVFRPGMITAHSATGASNSDDYVNRYLQTVVHLGAFIDDKEHHLDITAVDYVADAIASISLEVPRKHPGPFNVTNPQPPTYAAIGDAMRACGYELAALPYSAWRAKLIAAKNTPLEPLLSFFPEAELALHTPLWDVRNTAEAMQGVRPCPLLDAAMMKTYLTSLAARKLISLPNK